MPSDASETCGSASNLADHIRPLGLFAQAISGHPISLHAVDSAPDLSRHVPGVVGGAAVRLPPPIVLPESIDCFGNSAHNYAAYRVTILHQLGFESCGTFKFRTDKAQACLQGISEPDASATPISSFTPLLHPVEQFFRRFDNPGLIRQVFSMLESWRIDLYISRAYPGALSDLRRMMHWTLATQNEKLAANNLLNTLWQWTLCLDMPSQAPNTSSTTSSDVSTPIMRRACALVYRDEASVYDSAQAAIDIVDLIQTHNKLPESFDFSDETATADEDLQSDKQQSRGATIALNYRGDSFSPSAIAQRLRDGGDLADSDTQWTQQPSHQPDSADPDTTPDGAKEAPPAKPDDTSAQVTWIDEWNYLDQTWHRHWCRLFEYRLSGETANYRRTLLERYRDQLAAIRRQFSAIRPASLLRQRFMTDGDTVDLDAVVERFADRRAGFTGNDRLYERREPAERDIAAAFLLDMSASTDYPVPDPDNPETEGATKSDSGDEDEGWMLYSFARNRPSTPLNTPEPKPPRRVIDVARDSLALMSLALQALGDRFAIYGFSGRGRNRVTFGIAKHFDEKLSSRTWEALAGIEPQGATRMGAAVRHTTAKLTRVNARLKVMLIISDGYPQDLDYGPDRADDEYGLQDTAKALAEARLKGIQTFCLTVDPAGNDYLKRLCPDGRYLVIDEVNALPGALAKIYQGLTT